MKQKTQNRKKVKEWGGQTGGGGGREKSVRRGRYKQMSEPKRRMGERERRRAPLSYSHSRDVIVTQITFFLSLAFVRYLPSTTASKQQRALATHFPFRLKNTKNHGARPLKQHRSLFNYSSLFTTNYVFYPLPSSIVWSYPQYEF